MGSAAFTTAEIGRNSDVDVVTDPNAVLGIDTASNVHINSTETLVNTTNGFNQTVTVTVELRTSSTDRGDLVVNGENKGDQVSLSLSQDESANIQLAVPDDSSLVGKSAHFDIRASNSGLQVKAPNRSVPIKG